MSSTKQAPDDDDLLPSLDYKDWHKIILQIVPIFTGILSLCGSTLIIYVIIVERSYRKSVYHRLMLGMSIYDLLSSIGIVFFGYWAMPTEAINYVVGAKGNFNTCAAAGFLTNFLFGSMWYSGFLSIYFVYLIRYEKTERWLAHHVEPLAHLAALLTVFGTGINGIINNWFNPLAELPGICWFTAYPYRCDDDSSDYGEIDCIRGETAWAGAFMSGLFIFILIWSIIITSMVKIIRKVRTTEQRLRQYAGGINNNLERTKETGIQALLYIAVFFITFFPLILIDFIPYDAPIPLTFFCSILIKLFSPMQGFFNAFIYLRKRFRSLTSEGGALQIISQVISLRSRLGHTNNTITQQPSSRISNDVTMTTVPENVCLPDTILDKDEKDGYDDEECNSNNKEDNNINENIIQNDETESHCSDRNSSGDGKL